MEDHFENDPHLSSFSLPQKKKEDPSPLTNPKCVGGKHLGIWILNASKTTQSNQWLACMHFKAH